MSDQIYLSLTHKLAQLFDLDTTQEMTKSLLIQVYLLDAFN